MMVVVPGLPKGEPPEPGIIPRLIAGLVALGAKDVDQGVDGEGGMVGQHRAHHPGPEQGLAARHARFRVGLPIEVADEEVERIGKDRHNGVEAIDEAEFGKLREIGDQLRAAPIVPRGEEPKHVAPKEAVLHWRVGVLRAIGVLMMMAVVSGPP